MNKDKYRIVISVTKNDLKGKIIKTIANGIIVGTDDIIDAENTVENFLRLVDGLKDGEYKSYGVISIVNQRKGNLVESFHIN